MTPIYLRFPDQSEALAAFGAIVSHYTGATVEVETLAEVPPVVFLPAGPIFIDVVFGTGVVLRPTGETTTGEDGATLPVMAAIPGFHVNLLLPDGVDLPDALQAAQIQPANPACVWATP